MELKEIAIFSLTFLFLFSIISINGLAYQEFSANSHFNLTTNGIEVYNTVNTTYSRSSSCYAGVAGCLDFNASVGSTFAVLPTATNSSIIIFDGFLANETAPNIIIPPFKEVVLLATYYLNTSVSNLKNTIVIKEYINGTWYYGDFFSTNANASSGWHSVQTVLPASVSNRTIQAWLSFDGNNTHVQIHELKLYTYDLVEQRDSLTLFNNITDEEIRYCGESNNTLSTLGSGSAGYTFFPYYYNNGYGFLFVNTTNDQVSNSNFTGQYLYADCGIIALNGTVIARRVTQNEKLDSVSTNNEPILLTFRDFYLYLNSTANPSALNQATLITSFSLNSMQITNIKPAVPKGNISFNGIPTNYINISFFSNGSLLNSLVNITPYSTYSSPAGTLWNLIINHGTTNNTSEWHNFLSTSLSNIISCTPTTTCDILTNYETISDASCNVVERNYCGNCGCNSDKTACATPSNIGTICYPAYNALRGFKYVSASCTSDIYGLCPVGEECQTYTSISTNSTTNTVACLNLTTSINSYCINQYGNQVSCSTIKIGNTTIPTFTTNPAGSFALLIGGFFGITDLTLAENFSAIVFSLIIAMCVAFLVRKEPSMVGKAFMGSLAIVLIGFTIIGWFNAFLLVLILIFVVIMVAGVLNKVFVG